MLTLALQLAPCAPCPPSTILIVAPGSVALVPAHLKWYLYNQHSQVYVNSRCVGSHGPQLSAVPSGTNFVSKWPEFAGLLVGDSRRIGDMPANDGLRCTNSISTTTTRGTGLCTCTPHKPNT